MAKLGKVFEPVTSPVEQLIMSQPVLLSLLIMYQGVFSANAITIPERLQVLFDNRLFRFVSLMLIAFSATKNIAYAFISTLIFLGIIHALRTPEERKKNGLI
jgi:hypothetical protein